MLQTGDPNGSVGLDRSQIYTFDVPRNHLEATLFPSIVMRHNS
jgi:hypothetical protein